MPITVPAPLSAVLPGSPSASRPGLAVECIDPRVDARWDRWLDSHPQATVFHTAAWARVLAESYRFEPCYFTSVAADGTRVLLPMLEVDSWFTGRRGVSLPFSDFCPPLGDAGAGLPDVVFSALRAHARERGWRYIECRGGLPQTTGARPSLSYFTHDLDLATGEDALFTAFHPAVRRAIRKAEKSGLTTEVTTSAAAIGEFFRLQELTRRRHGLPPQPIDFFRRMREQILDRGMGFIVLARLNGAAVAGVIFFTLGRGALFKFGASDASYQASRPTNLVLWAAIRECLARGVTHLHFGRNATHHESLRRFKLSWGTREDRIDYVKFDCRTQQFSTDRSLLNGWQNRVFRRLPLPLSRLAGRILYRHIA